MATEAFTIAKRPGWGASVTVNIECDPLASMGVKIGLAVRVGLSEKKDLRGADLTGADLRGAYLTGADLRGADLTGADLRGAYLTGADLTGADLRGAYLRGAYLGGADLRDADLTGEKIARLVGQAERLMPGDQYTFYAFELEVGGVKVHAGCRWFTIPEFRAHVASQYPDTDKAADTLEILDYLERRALRVGAIKPDEPAPKKPRTKAKADLAALHPEPLGEGGGL